jgi:hypothetical protein
LTKSIILPDVTILIGMSSTHFVKQSVATNTNLCPLLDGGYIYLIKSIAQPLNDHSLIIGFNADARTL